MHVDMTARFLVHVSYVESIQVYRLRGTIEICAPYESPIQENRVDRAQLRSAYCGRSRLCMGKPGFISVGVDHVTDVARDFRLARRSVGAIIYL